MCVIASFPEQYMCHSLIPRTVYVSQPHSQDSICVTASFPSSPYMRTTGDRKLGGTGNNTMCLVNNLVIKYYSLKSSHTIRITNLLLVDLITRGLPIGSHELYLLA